jgi:hypothetical protein
LTLLALLTGLLTALLLLAGALIVALLAGLVSLLLLLTRILILVLIGVLRHFQTPCDSVASGDPPPQE